MSFWVKVQWSKNASTGRTELLVYNEDLSVFFDTSTIPEVDISDLVDAVIDADPDRRGKIYCPAELNRKTKLIEINPTAALPFEDWPDW